MTEITKNEVALEILKKDCIACRKCAIGGRRLDGSDWTSEPDEDGEYQPIGNVFSNMNHNAKVMVVGQNPGADEVAKGQPFVGASGQVFDEALERIVGISRDGLYITNVVKCYTQNNRKPTDLESDNCRYLLDSEVELVKPKVIVALGSIAFKALTGMSGIMKHCGEVVMSPRYMIPVIAMLHPSPYNTNDPERRAMFERAMENLAGVLKESNG